MRSDELLQNMEDIRSRLREAVDIAEGCGDPLIWAQLAQCLGHVCLSIRYTQDPEIEGRWVRRGRDPANDPRAPVSADLQELIIEALTLADMLGEHRTATRLNTALLCLSGKTLPAPAALPGHGLHTHAAPPGAPAP